MKGKNESNYRTLFLLGTSVRYRPPFVNLVAENNPFYGAAAKRHYDEQEAELTNQIKQNKKNKERKEELESERSKLIKPTPKEPHYGIVESLGFIASLINKNQQVSVRLKEDNTMIEKLEYYQHRLNDEVDIVDGVDNIGSEVYDRIAVGIAKILIAIHEGKTDIPIIGFSRGAVEAVIIAHELERIKEVLNGLKPTDNSADLIRKVTATKQEIGSELKAKLHDVFQYMRDSEFINRLNNAHFNMLIVDPVPGTGMGITWEDERFTNIPPIINHSVEYTYANEHTAGFYSIIPTGANCEAHVLPGQHGTGAGNFNDQQHNFVPRELGQTIHVQELMVLNQLLFLKQHGVEFHGDIDPILKADKFGGFALRKRYSNAPQLNKDIEEEAYKAPRVFGGYILNCKRENIGGYDVDTPESISYYDHLTREEVKIELSPGQFASLKQYFVGGGFIYPVDDATLDEIQKIIGPKNLHYKSNLIPMVEAFLANQKDPENNPFDANEHYLRIYSEIVKNKKAYEHYNNTSYGLQNAHVNPVTNKRSRLIFHKTRNPEPLVDVYPEYQSEFFLNEHHAQVWLNHELGITEELPPDQLITTIIDSIVAGTVVDPIKADSPKGDEYVRKMGENLHKLNDENVQKLFGQAIASIVGRLSDNYLKDIDSDNERSKQLFAAVGNALIKLSSNKDKSQIVNNLYTELCTSLNIAITDKCNILMEDSTTLLGHIEKQIPPSAAGSSSAPNPADNPEYKMMVRLSTILNTYQRIQKMIVDLKKFSLIGAQDFSITNLRYKLAMLEQKRDELFELAILEIKQQEKDVELQKFLEAFEKSHTDSSHHNITNQLDQAGNASGTEINPHSSFKNINLEEAQVNKTNALVSKQVDTMFKNHFSNVAMTVMGAVKLKTKLSKFKKRIHDAEEAKLKANSSSSNTGEKILENPIDVPDATKVTLVDEEVKVENKTATDSSVTPPAKPPKPKTMKTPTLDVSSIPKTDTEIPTTTATTTATTTTPVATTTTTVIPQPTTPTTSTSTESSEDVPAIDPKVLEKLRSEINQYLNHLRAEAKRIEPKLDLNDNPEDAKQKWYKIQEKYELVNGLSNKTLGNTPNLVEFGKGLNKIADTLKIHRDSDLKRRVKKWLSILAIGLTGVIPYVAYAKAKGKSLGFFTQTKGQQMVEKIEKITTPKKSK